jgi:hypothetical protein
VTSVFIVIGRITVYPSWSALLSLQVPGVEFRRHSMKEDRLRSSTAGTDPELSAPGQLAVGPQGTCRRRSFSVTPKGGLVNEGDELMMASSMATTSMAPSAAVTGQG